VVSVRVADEKYGNKNKFAKLFHKTLALIQSIAISRKKPSHLTDSIQTISKSM
jgi:hypothetical protein